MDFLHALILSFVEGVTEFLPISSTGHMVLVSQILNIRQTEFVKSFEIIIQLGAIAAVAILYYKKLLNSKIWPQIITAFLPAAFAGLFLYKIIKGYLLGNSLITVIALFMGGAAFIAVEYWNRRRKSDNEIVDIEKLSLRNAFIIGLFQSISVVPGVSRAGATILGALLLKTNRKTAAEFSFILAIPTMLAATTLDVVKTKLSFSQGEIITLLVGLVGSFVFALFAVKFLIKYLSSHDFVPFGVYRIIVAVIFYIIFLR